MSEHTRYPKARKRFGQNFLQDQQIIDDIVTAIGADESQHLVEIGPGRGALTASLLKDCGQLDVIELDRDLVPLLRSKFADASHLTIHEADALQFDYCALCGASEKLRVIGNLPYNITTPLLFHLLEQAVCIEDMCFMLQREVVERICAQPGTKSYGKLSIMVQYQCDASMLFIVPPEAFYPIPKVESAIIYLSPLKEHLDNDLDVAVLNKLVSQAFSQRRKTIANTLKNMLSVDELRHHGIHPTQRPETITVSQYVALSHYWQQQQ